MLIDVSFFTSGPRCIENASIATMPTSQSLSVNEAIEGYIVAFQEEFLYKVVGAELASALKDYMKLVENDEEKPDSVESPTSIFGLMCRKLREPFADYVFYHILRDANTQATMKGLVRLKCSNEYVSPVKRQVSTWNSMVDKIRLFIEWAMTDECPYKVRIDNNLLPPIHFFNL